MTTPRRLTAAALVLIALAGLGTASAARLGVGAAAVGAGSAAVVPCQPPDLPIRVGLTNTLSGGNHLVTAVRLSGIHADCVGDTMRVVLVGAQGAPLAPEIVATVGGASLVLPVPPVGGARPATSAVASVALAVHD